MTTLNVGDLHASENMSGKDSGLSIGAFVLPAVAWIAIWLGINSGPELLLDRPVDALGWAHFFRTLAPLFVLFALTPTMLSRRFGDQLPGATRLWFIYGLIGAAMCFVSPKPWLAGYWAACYLAVFVGMAAFLHGPDSLRRAMQLNYLSWMISAIFLMTLMYLAREVLFRGRGLGISGYNVDSRMPLVAEMAMSRASGMARFAAIPGVISFAMMWAARGWRKIPFIAIASASAYLIWAFQSRGAMLGFAAAIAFAMFFLGKMPRNIGVCLLLLLAIVASGRIVSDDIYQQLSQHITRGQNTNQMESMNGRTDLWMSAWQVSLRNPMGRGPQADRFFVGEHVHNTYLYALLEAGFIGASLFAAGLGWAWIMFFRAVRSDVPDGLGHRAFLVQVGAMLMFFTVRSIPEVCGAMYGVDLMVMLPAVAYLGLLDRRIVR